MATIEKRTNKNGETSYRALIRLKGHPAQSATFARITDAKKWVQDTESAIREGRYFKTNVKSKKTVGDLIDKYLTYVERENPKRLKEVKPQLEWWREQLGHCILRDLRKPLINEKIDLLSERTRTLKDGTAKPISPARVNRYIAALSHACTIATTQWEWMESNPVSGIKRRQEPKGRTRFLSEEEREALITACKQSKNPHLHTIVIIALSTGMRRGEIETLKWGHNVDLKTCNITLYDTKNDKTRTIALTGRSLELVRDLNKVRHLGSDLLFPSPTDKNKPINTRHAWEKAIERAGLEDFRFHDLRHSAASYLGMNGCSIHEIAEILGHSNIQVTMRYSHFTKEHTRETLASMNERIFGDG